MSKYIDRVLPKSEFARNVLTLFTGTSVAQAIPLLVSPILSRIYAPEDFGMFAFFISIVTIGGVLSTAMYESAIVLPSKDKDAVNLMAVCAVVTVSISALSLMGIVLSENLLTNLLGDTLPLNLFFLVPVLILLIGFFQSMNFWAIRRKEYRRLAVNKVSQNVVVAGGNVGLGALGLGLYGFVFAHLLGQIVSNAQLLYFTLFKDRVRLKLVSKASMKANAHRYRDFPRISLLQALLDTVQASLLFYIIQSIWGATELGFYAFMLRILRSPLTIIGTSVSQVFYQRSSQAYNAKENLHALLIKALRNLLYIGLPIFIFLFIFSPWLFSFAFGAEWQKAGEYARILCPWLFVNFLYSPVSQLPLTLGKQKINFLIGFIYNSLILLSIAGPGYLGYDIETAFQILSGSLTIFLLLVIYWLIQITKNPYVKKY